MPVSRRSRFRSPFTLLFVLIAVAASVASAFADTVRGRVVDPDDRAVAGATVLVVSGPRIVATMKTTNDGHFGPIAVPAGKYDVLVSAPGLKADPTSIDVTADAAIDLNLKLAISAVTESVVVSAAQVDTPLSRTTDSVTVIDRATLNRRQTETVADALRDVPGMNVVQSGGRGAVTSIFPRGGESDYTLVLVDGIEQNTFGGGFDAAHLAAGEVDRIEVVRGPESALYGDGAIGGIVQIVTRHGGPTHRAGVHRRRRIRHLEQQRVSRRRLQGRGAGAARSTGSRPMATRASSRQSTGRCRTTTTSAWTDRAASAGRIGLIAAFV